MSQNILDLELCYDFFFLEKGLAAGRFPKPWATDHDGRKFVEHEGKRCLVRAIPLLSQTGPIKILKSGK